MPDIYFSPPKLNLLPKAGLPFNVFCESLSYFLNSQSYVPLIHSKANISEVGENWNLLAPEHQLCFLNKMTTWFLTSIKNMRCFVIQKVI